MDRQSLGCSLMSPFPTSGFPIPLALICHFGHSMNKDAGGYRLHTCACPHVHQQGNGSTPSYPPRPPTATKSGLGNEKNAECL